MIQSIGGPRTPPTPSQNLKASPDIPEEGGLRDFMAASDCLGGGEDVALHCADVAEVVPVICGPPGRKAEAGLGVNGKDRHALWDKVQPPPGELCGFPPRTI